MDAAVEEQARTVELVSQASASTPLATRPEHIREMGSD